MPSVRGWGSSSCCALSNGCCAGSSAFCIVLRNHLLTASASQQAAGRDRDRCVCSSETAPDLDTSDNVCQPVTGCGSGTACNAHLSACVVHHLLQYVSALFEIRGSVLWATSAGACHRHPPWRHVLLRCVRRRMRARLWLFSLLSLLYSFAGMCTRTGSCGCAGLCVPP